MKEFDISTLIYSFSTKGILLPQTENIKSYTFYRQHKKAQEPYPKPILPTEAFALPVKRKNK